MASNENYSLGEELDLALNSSPSPSSSNPTAPTPTSTSTPSSENYSLFDHPESTSTSTSTSTNTTPTTVTPTSTSSNPSSNVALPSSGSSSEPRSAPTRMKGVIYMKYGEPDVLQYVENLAVPNVEANDVLVKVYASSVNPIDWKMRKGYLDLVIPGHWPKVPGFDVSGVIVQVGKNVTNFKVGDEVFGMAHFRRCGACAEFMSIQASNIQHKPKTLSHLEAATLPLVGLTVWQALVTTACVVPGQTILILGGSSGTGSFAIQLAKNYLNAKVITTCSSRNVDFVKNLGADEIIDYTANDWGTVLHSRNIDVVLDCVGESTSYDKSKTVLKKDGHFVTIIPADPKDGFGFKTVAQFAGSLISRKCAQWFAGAIKYSAVSCESNQQQLGSIAELADRQKIKPLIDKMFFFDQLKAAHEYSESGRTKGKIAIRII